MAGSGAWVGGCGLAAQIPEGTLRQEAFLGLRGWDPAMQERDISITPYRCGLRLLPSRRHALAPSRLRLSHPIGWFDERLENGEENT